jgi:predicted choloylglycine hydrolase
MIMQEITLRGTPAQMGAQHGAILAQTGLELPPPQPAMQQLADACEETAVQHTPELVEEMRAFADAVHIPYDTLKTFTLTIPLQQTMPSCSVVAVMPERSANGKLMVGRNYDFAYHISWEGATRYTTHPDKGYAHIGNSDIWIGREDGLNAAGLFVAMSATFISGVQAGLPFWFIVRHLLETCTTVDEALVWIQSVPHSQSRNYMLADNKKAVVVEASIDGCRVREPEDGVLVMTNHPMHPDFRPRAAFVPDDSPIRYNRLRTFPTNSITLNDMQSALNDRENAVCAHAQFDGQTYGTIWSVIAYPQDRQIDIAPGTGDNQGTMVYRSYKV